MHARNRASLIGSISVVALSLFAADGRAQNCFGPDNLDNGNCWQPVNANLPPYPDAQLPGLGICWDQCSPTTTTNLRVEWDTPTQIVCAEYVSPLRVFDAGSGALLLGGTMNLNYTRTWFEMGPNNQLMQVWRFVAKVDLGSTAGVNPVCPVPSCVGPAGPHPDAFFYGYVDYAQICGQPQFTNVLVLYHACDHFIHGAISDKPGVFHPGRSYGIVAPHTTINPFVPGNAPQPGGPLVAEAIRDVAVPGTAACMVEDRIQSGDLLPLGTGCVCTLSGAPAHNTLSRFDGKASCVNAAGLQSTFSALFIAFPLLPWPYLTASSMGSWTTGATYPGPERVWAEEGFFSTYQSCDDNNWIEIYYGAMTDNGYQVIPMTPVDPATQKFLDLVDNYSVVFPGPHPLPFTGKVMPSDHLIYVNVP